jgi:hypothetical protein
MAMMMRNFKELTTYKKGKLFEDYFFKYLDSSDKFKNTAIYRNINDCSEIGDFFILQDGLRIELKAKDKRRCYPDTGFNYKHYKIYTDFDNTYNMKTLILYLDSKPYKGEHIYGHYLNELKPYKTEQGKGVPIVYFKIDAMKTFSTLFGDRFPFEQELLENIEQLKI